VKVKEKVKVTTPAGSSRLQNYGAHQKALQLFDHVVADLALLAGRTECQRLVAQHYASADSIASNIEEGYGRGSRRDYAHFLVIARGSAQETAGRYLRFRHWLPVELTEQRAALCGEIIAILTASILRLREQEKISS
jgi:four helix bundle protein